MKIKLLIPMLLIVLSFKAFPAVGGLPLTDADFAHLLGGAYITKLCESNEIDPFTTFLIVLGVGVLKETYDLNRTGFSASDIAYTVAGFGVSISIDEVMKIWK